MYTHKQFNYKIQCTKSVYVYREQQITFRPVQQPAIHVLCKLAKIVYESFDVHFYNLHEDNHSCSY